MKFTRTTALAALVLVALAAPIAAFALDDGSDGGGTNREANHAKHDKPAKHHGKPDHATGQDRADEASAAGRAHAEAMKKWARCVAEAASGPKGDDRVGPPKDACGEKPMGPGRAKHQADRPAHPTPPGRSEEHLRGKSETHRSH